MGGETDLQRHRPTDRLGCGCSSPDKQWEGVQCGTSKRSFSISKTSKRGRKERRRETAGWVTERGERRRKGRKGGKLGRGDKRRRNGRQFKVLTRNKMGEWKWEKRSKRKRKEEKRQNG